MPGFRYCQWCNGKGCIACDAEEKKFNQKVADSAPKWRKPDVRDVRDAVIRAEFERGMRPGLDAYPDGRIDAMTPDEVEAAMKPLLDAEYERQFPGGPKPSLVVRLDSPADMDLLKRTLGRDAITAAFADGGSPETVGRLMDGIDAARLVQSARVVLCPNPEDTEEQS